MTNDNKHNRPDLLVETEWLAEHLDDPNLRIVDMGPIDAYKRGHIPGSMGLNRDYFKDPDNRVLVMGPDQFAKAMSEVGIGDEHDVIAYDDWGGLYAGRLWWLLRMHGHEKVRVLNGGWNKWMSEGRPVEAVPLSLYHSGKPMSPHAPATFTVKPAPRIQLHPRPAEATAQRARMGHPGRSHRRRVHGRPDPGQQAGRSHTRHHPHRVDKSRHRRRVQDFPAPCGAKTALRIGGDHSREEGSHLLTGRNTCGARNVCPPAPRLRERQQLRRLNG